MTNPGDFSNRVLWPKALALAGLLSTAGFAWPRR
jgi:hypothetical protein